MIAGQGTAAWELLDQAGPLDIVLCPVGGGGLASGTCLAVKGRSPGTRVFGAEPAAADDALRSSPPAASSPRTTRKPSPTASAPRSARRPSPSSIATSTPSSPPPTHETLHAMRFVGSGSRSSSSPPRRPLRPRLIAEAPPPVSVGVILSGGNVDLEGMFQGLAKSVGWVSSATHRANHADGGFLTLSTHPTNTG